MGIRGAPGIDGAVGGADNGLGRRGRDADDVGDGFLLVIEGDDLRRGDD